MTRIPDLLAQGRTYSFEFFPPRTPEAEATLERTLVELEPLHPAFVSVTYGAGGSTRERTHDLVVNINRMTGMTAMGHLTCVGHSCADLEGIVARYRDAGIDNILALGGDPPADVEVGPSELTYAVELVRLIRTVGDFAVGVAAHPEPHPRSPDVATDRRHTAEKLAEADFAITQFFFEVDHYVAMMDDLASHDVYKPVIPGIMPVTNLAQVSRMAHMSGAEVPGWLVERVGKAGDDPDEATRIGVEIAAELCDRLLEVGAPGLHFYTLNRSGPTRQLWRLLGLG